MSSSGGSAGSGPVLVTRVSADQVKGFRIDKAGHDAVLDILDEERLT